LNDYTGKCKAFSGKKKPHVWLYGDKRNLVDYIEHRGNINGDDERISLSLPLDINDKYEVPGEMCSIKTKLDWFAG
jgi:hypothetical protein